MASPQHRKLSGCNTVKHELKEGSLAEPFSFYDDCYYFRMQMKFEKHIFICTNQRAAGEKKSCGEACGMELVREFKRQLKEKNLKGRMRAQRAGCLDACEYGPALVIYPEGVFYRATVNDVTEIVDEHLIGNRIVKNLQIDFESTGT